VNVTGWFSRASLDIIGEGVEDIPVVVRLRTNFQSIASFDFQFKSLDNKKNPLVLRDDDGLCGRNVLNLPSDDLSG